jgi:hypothetical protein
MRVPHEAELIKALQESIADLSVAGVGGQGAGNRFGVPGWELLPLQQFQYGDFRIEMPATTVIVETESAGVSETSSSTGPCCDQGRCPSAW